MRGEKVQKVKGGGVGVMMHGKVRKVRGTRGNYMKCGEKEWEK